MNETSAHFFIKKTISTALGLLIILCACQPAHTIDASPIQPTQTVVAKTPTNIPPTKSAAPETSAEPETCVENKGSVINESVPSEILSDEIHLRIYLPPCYNKSPEKEYAVLYMLHGQTSPDDQWISLGLLTSMDGLLMEKKVIPFIIVLPGEERSNIEGYDSLFGDALVQEVIPFVDQYYQTCAKRACRAIGGLSRGGNWAVHLGFAYPEVFSAVGAHSAPLFYGELTTINYIINDDSASTQLPVFYIDVGDRDEDRNDVLLFSSMLQKKNIPHTFNAFLGYHDAKYWSAHIPDYLLWYSSQFANFEIYDQ